MRRITPDFSYKKRTREIVERNFDAWQLVRRDPREGLHRYLNEVVSFSDELDREITHVENLFFPDAMDLGEEWVIYGTFPRVAEDDLYISGEPISSYLPRALTIDEFIGGEFDMLVPHLTVSGEVFPETEVPDSIVAQTIDHVFLTYGPTVVAYNPKEEQTRYTLPIGTTLSGEVVLYADRLTRNFAIWEDLDFDSLVLLDSESGEVPFSLIRAEDTDGYWDSAFDANGDGIIGEYEKNLLDSVRRTGTYDHDPDDWDRIKWADVDGDGYIGDADYRYVSRFFTSMAPGMKAVLEVHAGYAGAFTLHYNHKTPQLVRICRFGKLYETIMDDNSLSEDYAGMAQDSHTGIWYAIRADGTAVYALRLNAERNGILAANELHVPIPDSDCRFIDLDIWNGYLYVLVSCDSGYRVYFADIWQDFVEELPSYLRVEFNAGFVPERMSVSRDGYFVFAAASCLELYVPKRDKYAVINDELFMNRRYEMTTAAGDPVVAVPTMVFNNWDSFIYSIGIERPWGCDNQRVKDIIYDFFRYPQGNDRTGMNYGLMRDLGYLNTRLMLSSPSYILPERIDLSYPLYMDDEEVTVLESGIPWVLSGQAGVFDLYDESILRPHLDCLSTLEPFVLRAYFYDREGDSVEVEHTVAIETGDPEPPFEIHTYGERDFLEDRGFLVSGEPTDELIEIVAYYEENSPYRYGNAITDMTSTQIRRPSAQPIVPTTYSPSLSGLLDETEELTLTI